MPNHPSVLILTAGFGEGHNTAARALAAGCDAIQGPGTARVADVFALTAPRLNDVSRRAYLKMINGMPRVWSRAYAWMDRSTLLPRALGRMSREMRKLSQIIREDRPAVICSTFPAYSFLIERLRRESPVSAPHYMVVTDSISVNSLWWRAGCSGWFVPNEDTAAVMRTSGVEDIRLCVSGFPVNPFFSLNAGVLAPPDLSAGARPRVLVMVNAGSRNGAAIARRILAEEDWDVTCALGRNERLRRELEMAAAPRRHPARILGWTRDMPELMMTHHVLVAKAGGATTQEAVAARCPMVVSQVVPGQEEGNYELLRRHGAGTLASTPEAAAAALARAFAGGGAAWRQWREALGPLSRPEAAHTIASHLLCVAAESAGAPPAAAALPS